MGLSHSCISRVTGVDVSYKNFNKGAAASLPQRLAIIGQGNSGIEYSTKKFEVQGSAIDVAEKYGYGSPLHLAAMQLFPVAGESASFPVTIYPVAEGPEAVAATGNIGVTGEATENGNGSVYIGGIRADFAIRKGDNANAVMTKIKTAIDSVLEMPVTTGVVAENIPLTAKFKGTSGNMISVIVECSTAGLVFSVQAMKDGAIDGDVDDALAKIGNVWETFVLDLFPYSDTTRLDKYENFGRQRWSAEEKKPLLVAHGCTDDYETRTAITDARPTDYINFLVTSTGSRELPFVVAAKAMVSDIVTTADANPACGYKGLLTGLHAGDDDVIEPYSVRNMSIQKGSSNNIKNGSVAELNDIVTFYHPENEGKYSSRRYVCDLVKLMNVVFNVRLIMEADEKKGVPLIPDEDVTTNPSAIQPKVVKTELVNLAFSLAKKAIISDAKFTKKNLSVDIDDENPKRLNVKFPVKLSGNIEVSNADIYFGFYLGGN